MKKLCLILTVLYAIWANCSAQSLNIARNLWKVIVRRLILVGAAGKNRETVAVDP